jgi:hypothetical protein
LVQHFNSLGHHQQKEEEEEEEEEDRRSRVESNQSAGLRTKVLDSVLNRWTKTTAFNARRTLCSAGVSLTLISAPNLSSRNVHNSD